MALSILPQKIDYRSSLHRLIGWLLVEAVVRITYCVMTRIGQAISGETDLASESSYREGHTPCWIFTFFLHGRSVSV